MDISITNKEISECVCNRKFSILKDNKQIDKVSMILEEDLLHARVFLSEETNSKTLKIYEEYLSKEGYQDIFLCVPKENKKLIAKLSDHISLGEDEEDKYLIFMSEDMNKHENFKK